MILIDTNNQECIYDDIERVIKDVIDLDNKGINYNISFENNHYYKCDNCLSLFVSDKLVSCPYCMGYTYKVI